MSSSHTERENVYVLDEESTDIYRCCDSDKHGAFHSLVSLAVFSSFFSFFFCHLPIFVSVLQAPQRRRNIYRLCSFLSISCNLRATRVIILLLSFSALSMPSSCFSSSLLHSVCQRLFDEIVIKLRNTS